MKKVEVFAPAKINLTLHVTGQRADGYHLLDSLVVFPDVGDLISVTTSDDLTLTVDGAFGHKVPAGDDNLVLRVAKLLTQRQGARINLTKNLPPASGVGGGSSDAAATLKALSQLWGVPVPGAETLMALGADVPVCLRAEPCRMSGIGENLTPWVDLPDLGMVLVNPGAEVLTPGVFKALKSKSNPPMMPLGDNFLDWLSSQRNDLQAAAIQVAPVIADVLAALMGIRGCKLARMSGSGATCFGLFDDPDAAAATLRSSRPNWWVQPARTSAS